MFKKKNKKPEWFNLPIEEFKIKEFEKIKLDRCEQCKYSPMCYLQRHLASNGFINGEIPCPFYKIMEEIFFPILKNKAEIMEKYKFDEKEFKTD